MAVVARYLLDTSAAARMTHTEVAAVVSPLIGAGLVATCAALDFEALYSATSPEDYLAISRDRRLAYEYLPTDDEHWSRAMDVQRTLAERSQHRSVGLPDLLIAAIAEAHRLTLLHYDSDFDVLAAQSHLQAAWIVPRGSV